jgi:hypothetical protein
MMSKEVERSRDDEMDRGREGCNCKCVEWLFGEIEESVEVPVRMVKSEGERLMSSYRMTEG